MNQLEHRLCFWNLACSILQKKKHLAHLHQRLVLEIQVWTWNQQYTMDLSVTTRNCLGLFAWGIWKKWWRKKVVAENKPIICTKILSKAEVLNDVYGERTGTYYEYGLETDGFNAKLISVKEKWEALIPGFYGWFDINQKILFTETVIQSAREKTDIQGFYYQNGVEFQYAVKKCMQNYKKEDILVVIKTLERLSDRHDTEEVRALYRARSYTINEPYKTFLVQRSE